MPLTSTRASNTAHALGEFYSFSLDYLVIGSGGGGGGSGVARFGGGGGAGDLVQTATFATGGVTSPKLSGITPGTVLYIREGVPGGGGTGGSTPNPGSVGTPRLSPTAQLAIRKSSSPTAVASVVWVVPQEPTVAQVAPVVVVVGPVVSVARHREPTSTPVEQPPRVPAQVPVVVVLAVQEPQPQPAAQDWRTRLPAHQ